jgi:uncharacterized coiled-coil protein SlyX
MTNPISHPPTEEKIALQQSMDLCPKCLELVTNRMKELDESKASSVKITFKNSQITSLETALSEQRKTIEELRALLIRVHGLRHSENYLMT